MPSRSALDRDRRRDQRLLGAVEIAHELFEAAVVEQFEGLHVGMAAVGEHDAHAGVEEGELAQPVLQRPVVELDHGEGLGRRQEGDLGAAASLIGAGDVLRLVAAGRLQRRIGDRRG